jgi:hypothetical protein
MHAERPSTPKAATGARFGLIEFLEDPNRRKILKGTTKSRESQPSPI